MSRELLQQALGALEGADQMDVDMQDASTALRAALQRQQHVMQRAIDAWDSTTHQKNGDGRLWQCMEELRGECAP